MMQMGKEYTIEEFIKEYNQETINYGTLHLKEVFQKDDGNLSILSSESVLSNYDDELKKYVVTLTLTDSEFNKFQYNPKFLSFELYNTTELWFMLLHANELYYSGQFDINPIKVYSSDIVNIIDRILNLEKQYIDLNREDVSAQLG